MTGLMLPVIFASTISVVEIGRVQTLKAMLQNELDASVVTCAMRYGNTVAKGADWDECYGIDIEDRIEARMDRMDVTSVVWKKTGENSIGADIEATLEPLVSVGSFMDGWDFAISTEAIIGRKTHLEIVLALDISFSMKGDPYERMKAAAAAFIDTLRSEAGPDTPITISILPFSDTVRFPAAYSQWLPPEFQNWNRSGPNPFEKLQQDSDDICIHGTMTSKADGGTRCIPYSAWNGCFADGTDEWIMSRAMEHVPNFLPEIGLVGQADKSDDYRRFGYCPGEGVTALLLETDTRKALAMIGDMDQYWQAEPPRRGDMGFGTGTDTAMSWGWRLLHPSNRGKFFETNTAPGVFSDETFKHLVLLTDGQPIGMARKNDPDRYNSARRNLESICASIRDENSEDTTINVWPIAYRNNHIVMPEVKGCVGGDGSYHDASTSDVIEIFTKIGRSIARSNVRISK